MLPSESVLQLIYVQFTYQLLFNLAHKLIHTRDIHDLRLSKCPEN